MKVDIAKILNVMVKLSNKWPCWHLWEIIFDKINNFKMLGSGNVKVNMLCDTLKCISLNKITHKKMIAHIMF